MKPSIALSIWNQETKAVSFQWPQGIGPARVTESLLNHVELQVEVDGERLNLHNWASNGDRCISAECCGIQVTIELSLENTIKALVRNHSEIVHQLDRFVFRATPVDSKDFLSIPGNRLRIYREGWTMTSAAGSVRLGDSDFAINPVYKPFAVSDTKSYCEDRPNQFSGEYVSVVNDRESGISVLAGFVTSADQVTRTAIAMNENGISCFEAISYGDGIELSRGESVASEELIVLAGDDGYGLLEEFARIWGARMKVAPPPAHLPTGWCSWYYYYEHVTENDILENVKWLSERNDVFPLEYIQLDDGYQSALGDWLVCDGVKFPNGLEFLAKQIASAGLKPGLWLAPFMVEDCSRLFAEHPEWMIRNEQGEVVWVTEWRNSRVAVLDATVPEAAEWLTGTFARLRSIGFEYVKLDFLMYECAAIAMGGRYADRKATRAQALRRGLAAIRKGIGDKFILGCTSPLGPEVGMVDGCRIGTDITPNWQDADAKPYKESCCVPNVCRNVINRSYMNRRLWINDPDVHIARIDNNRLTEDEVILWTSALWLVGGMVLLCDRFSTLAPERTALSQMLLRDLGRFENVRPLDIFDREFPSIWLARNQSKPSEYALGLFNFDAVEQNLLVDFSKVHGLEQTRFTVKEYWTNTDIGLNNACLEAAVRPHSCKVYLLNIQP